MSSNPTPLLATGDAIPVADTSCQRASIIVRHLGKCYQIYDTPRNRLKQFIMPHFQRFFRRKPSRYFEEFWAVSNATFTIQKGETVGVIGRNGSGKSTLLQMICGTLSPTTGSIEVNGRVAALLELGAGFNPEFSGRENIYMSAALVGLTSQEIDERFDSILAFADIGSFVDQPVKTYSSGMFVRLAFAIHANIDPDIFIVDEALAVGDTFFVHKCMLRFREMQEQGKTILFVSHDVNAVRNLCERAIWLENGTIKHDAQSSAVVDRYLAHLFGHPVADTSHREICPQTQQNEQRHTGRKPQEDTIPNIDRRLGNQACSLIGVGLYDNNMQPVACTKNDTTVVLRMTIRNNTLDNSTPLVAGYVFRNAKGQEIASTNSVIERTPIGPIETGSVVTITMHVTLPLLYPGSYAFSPVAGYLTELNVIELSDRVENAIVFEVTSDITINVMMNLHTLITVDDENIVN